jgi:hypothetical protein
MAPACPITAGVPPTFMRQDLDLPSGLKRGQDQSGREGQSYSLLGAVVTHTVGAVSTRGTQTVSGANERTVLNGSIRAG